jgi:hypothetical protein
MMLVIRSAPLLSTAPRSARNVVRRRSYPEPGQFNPQRELYVSNGKRDEGIATAEDDEAASSSLGGAIATLVFGAALLSERLNGIGIVQNLELHDKGAHPLLVGSIAGLLLAAAWPDQREAPQQPNAGFVAQLQKSVSRLAYVGLAGAIAAEMYTGKGILALLDVETGVEVLSDVEALAAFVLMIFLTGDKTKLRK